MRAMYGVLGAMAAVAAMVGPAEARRTEIDGDGALQLGGYCDLNGDDCTPVSLGYSVDFGGGPLDSVLIYGNGLLTFGGTAADTTRFNGSLADYGVPAVALALTEATTSQSQGSGDTVFYQTARLSIGTDGTIDALWQICRSSKPSGCGRQYELTLTRVALGYQATGVYESEYPGTTMIAGYSIPGGPTDEQRTRRTSFLIPASFGTAAATSDAPEPATWAMLVAGFGLVGGALRRRAIRPALRAA